MTLDDSTKLFIENFHEGREARTTISVPRMQGIDLIQFSRLVAASLPIDSRTRVPVNNLQVMKASRMKHAAEMMGCSIMTWEFGRRPRSAFQPL